MDDVDRIFEMQANQLALELGFFMFEKFDDTKENTLIMIRALEISAGTLMECLIEKPEDDDALL